MADKPPDLDEVLRELKKKFNLLFNKKNNNITNINNNIINNNKIIINSKMIYGIGIVLLGIWVLLGLFIVAPSEKSVILRFGKYVETVNPGLHWIPRFIESQYTLNVQQVLTYPYQAEMLTQDENIVSIDLVVKYRISNLYEYLFHIENPKESLQQATASALRQVVGQTNLDAILTSGRELVREQTLSVLERTLSRYHSGLLVTGVSLQTAKPPEEVTAAFDDAIKAREDEKRFKNQALTYANRIVPTAQGNAARLIAEANGYKQQVILNAKAQTAYYLAVLPEYQAHPAIMRERLYLETMQSVLSHTVNIIANNTGQNNNLMYLPLDKLMNNSGFNSGNNLQNPAKTAASQNMNDKPINLDAQDLTAYPARPNN